jgi:hypothetical protein
MNVGECKIVVRYTYRNHRDEFKDYKEEFVSFLDFRNYWRWQPERAKAINGEQIENSRTSNARLYLYVQDDEHTDEIYFNKIADFTDYLKRNPMLAKAIQYL